MERRKDGRRRDRGRRKMEAILLNKIKNKRTIRSFFSKQSNVGKRGVRGREEREKEREEGEKERRESEGGREEREGRRGKAREYRI